MVFPKEKTYRNFIDGEWIEAVGKKVYRVANPANRDLTVGHFPLSSADDVDLAVNAAHKAFQTWRNVPANQRAECVYRLIQLIDDNKEELGSALCFEEGKPYAEAISEPKRAVHELRFIAGEATRLNGTVLPSDRETVIDMAVRVPIGVIAAITPWNFPILTPLRKVIPALVCGCTVVLKPASQTPLTSVLLCELMEKAGFPAGTVNLVMGRGSEIGDALAGHKLVRGVSLTGSTEVGHRVYAAAARNFTKIQLEMGGKNPCVVADFADIKNCAAQIVGAAFTNAGQRCTSISRVIVLEHQAAELEKYLAERISKFKVGRGETEGTNIGPLVSESALNNVLDNINSAVAEGARIVCGGKRLTGDEWDKGNFMTPALLADVKPDMKIAREEVFGPLLIIIPVKTYEDAIRVCNDTEYGLTASIFTDKMEWGFKFMRDVESGMIHINNGTVSEGHMPFGGVKNSGVGVYSIGGTNKDFFTDLKVTYVQYS